MPRTWLITGVSSGFGRAIAKAALKRGDLVAGTVRSPADAEAFDALDDRAWPFILDVTDARTVKMVVEAVERQLGDIDVLVNNAGYCLLGGVEETALDEVRAQFEVNVFGALAVIKAVMPAMRRRRAGVVVNITSVSGLSVWPGAGVYCASKAALVALTQSLAAEAAELGIRVMNVAPGGLRTDFGSRSLKVTQTKLADYDGLARASERIVADRTGHESGDPDRAAQALMAAIDVSDPPLHLLLGEDALKYAAINRERLWKDIESWRDITTSIAFGR
jgi:NAD(P)-dependent dehydrogenase (short-subunit alcohol dehydrogenase family)